MQTHQSQDFKTPSSREALLQALLPAILTCMLVAAIWPFYKYYVDSDGISYLNITSQYVAGNYTHAINAFWSPMGCWATALLVKCTHWPLFQSAITVNTIPAAGMVFFGQRLFQKFRHNAWERWCLGIATSIFYTYATYFQSFTDLWQFLFLTIGLLILLRKDFTEKPFWWLFIGVLGALSFYGKAYSFVFYPVMILVVSALQLQARGQLTVKRMAVISIVSVGIMMLCIAPWVYLLHQKYGIWTYSTAGKLNMNWWLVGTQEFRPDIHALVPPAYKGSLFYFEDPYYAQGTWLHFWDSPRLFAKQLARVGFNGIQWVFSCNRISAFYFPVWLLSILFLIRKKQTLFQPTALKIVAVILLIFPLPYWLLTFDRGRYLWWTIPMVSILAFYMLDAFAGSAIVARWRKCFVAVFFISFTITPIADLKEMYKLGYSEHAIAEQLNALHIKGSFIANKSYADASAQIISLAWFSQNAWYCHPLSDFTTKELLEDATRYHVKYYFYFYKGTGEDFQLRDLNGVLLKDLTHNTINGLKVFQIGNE